MITIDQRKLTDIQNKKRIIELKQLLLESDFRMTNDYFNEMSVQDQEYWANQRNSWRTELRGLL